MAIPTTSVRSSAQLVTAGAVSTGSYRRAVCCKTRKTKFRIAVCLFLGSTCFTRPRSTRYRSSGKLCSYLICSIFFRTCIYDSTMLLADSRSKKCVTDYSNTRKENSKAIEWTAVKQGHGSLHGENEVQNKQGHHEHQQHRENCELKFILPPVQSLRTEEQTHFGCDRHTD